MTPDQRIIFLQGSLTTLAALRMVLSTERDTVIPTREFCGTLADLESAHRDEIQKLGGGA